MKPRDHNNDLRAPALAEQHLRRAQLGRALAAYVYGEFTNAIPPAGWFAPRHGGAWLWSALGALLVAVSITAGAVLLRAEGGGAAELAGVVLLLLGIATLYGVLFGLLLARVCLTTFGWHIRESFEDRARTHVVGILFERAAAPSNASQEALDAWRQDLASLSKRRTAFLDRPWMLPAVMWLVLIGVVPFVFGGVVGSTGLFARIDAVAFASPLFPVVATGLALILASRLVRRVNDELYELTLRGEIQKLAALFGSDHRVAGYSGGSAVGVLANAGIGLAGAGVGVLALGLVL